MKKMLLKVVLLLGGMGNIVLQAQNPIMSLPPNYINISGDYVPLPIYVFDGFNEITPTSDPTLYNNIVSNPDNFEELWEVGYCGQTAKACHNIQHDIDGNLLFFIVDNFVYDKFGKNIGNFNWDGQNDIRGSNEILIVPDPVNCQRYHIFIAGFSNLSDGYDISTGGNLLPFYALINMDFDSWDGVGGAVNGIEGTSEEGFFEIINNEVVINLTPLLPNYDPAPKALPTQFAATDLRSDNTRLVFITNGTDLYTLKIEATGTISFQGHFPLGINDTEAASEQNIRAELELFELANGSYRMAIPYKQALTNDRVFAIEIIEVDANGNRDISTKRTILFSSEKDFIKGVEFSPDGEVLYVGISNLQTPSNSGLYYIDNINNTPNLLLNSTTFGDYKDSHIELKNGLLMFVKDNSLGTLSNSNTPASAVFTSNFQTIAYDENFLFKTSVDPDMKLFLLPDQIDDADYFAPFFADPSCCAEVATYNVESFTASGTDTWTATDNPLNNGTGSIATIQQVITIPSTANITIQGMELRFSPTAKIEIQAGGRLTIDGTILTVDDRCGAELMWQGVTMIDGSNQNTFVMRNNARIEHALIGVSAGKGLINANTSTFFNNQTDVQIITTSQNRSRFNNCQFITNGRLNDPTLITDNHVFLSGVSGVSFAGCTFANQTPNDYLGEERGTGIRSSNAKYTVNPQCFNKTCSSLKRGRFENLHYGINANDNGANTTKTITVDRQDFVDNHFGIYFKSVNVATVTRNTFRVDTPIDLLRSKTTYGLYLDASTGYKVEENSFMSLYSNELTFGVVVNASGEANNEIYKNTFSSLRIGVLAQGDNGINFVVPNDPSSVNTYTGLQILCNTFSLILTDADIAVAKGEINYHQGFCVGTNTTKPAGNQFSFSSFELLGQNSQLFEYDHHSSTITTPVTFGTNIELDDCNVAFDPTKSCPTKIHDPSTTPLTPIKDTPGREGLVVQPDMLQEIEQRRALIDLGNTDQLMADAQNVNARFAKERMLLASPYITNEALLAYLESNRPVIDVRDVILANSPVSKTVLEKVQSLNMPKNMMKAITDAQVGTSAMQELRKEISALTSERDFWVNEVIRWQLNDTLNEDNDTIIEILKFESTLDFVNRAPQLADFYMAKGDVDNANAVLNEYRATIGENNYTKLAAVQLELIGKSDMKQEFENNPALKDQVIEVANNANERFFQARGENILSWLDGIVYEPYIEEIIIPAQMREENTNNNALQIGEESVAVNIYPNPSKTSQTIVFALEKEKASEPMTVEVIDMIGTRIALVELNESNPTQAIEGLLKEKGIYFVKITNHKGDTSFRKLVVE